MELEEMKEVTYVGYKFKRSEGQEGHVRERVKKGNGSYGSGMGNRKEEIWRKLEKKNGVIRLARK